MRVARDLHAHPDCDGVQDDSNLRGLERAVCIPPGVERQTQGIDENPKVEQRRRTNGSRGQCAERDEGGQSQPAERQGGVGELQQFIPAVPGHRAHISRVCTVFPVFTVLPVYKPEADAGKRPGRP